MWIWRDTFGNRRFKGKVNSEMTKAKEIIANMESLRNEEQRQMLRYAIEKMSDEERKEWMEVPYKK